VSTWQVTLDALLARTVEEDAVIELNEDLAAHGARVTGIARRLSVTLTIEDAFDALDAAERARHLVRAPIELHDLDVDMWVGVEVLTGEEADRQLEQSPFPALIGAAEAADILGVTRQRIHQLHHDHPLFPPPVVELRMGPLWTLDSVRGFAARWERRPGRPRRTETPQGSAATPGTDVGGDAAVRRSASTGQFVTQAASRTSPVTRSSSKKSAQPPADPTSRAQKSKQPRHPLSGPPTS
jgi:hypothetical protein